ncbi:MAG: hypothetical protein QGF90_04850 [Gammaproteobacteria bacterium]|jgi:hypothetical protein|nr:hypothetical protein [Gammaproteobacteria bacterium]|tara:strand:+ start:1863 stop:2222 length:360 start_codon:yes stop_codon:yes gene_type:complete
MTDALMILSAALAVYLTQQQNRTLQKYACLVGLAGQPVWFYVTWQLQQWGMFICAVVFTFSWLLGAWNHWVVPWLVTRTDARWFHKLTSLHKCPICGGRGTVNKPVYFHMHKPGHSKGE